MTQRPEAQRSPAAQLVPHAPQLAGSESSVAQVPPHSACPVGHDVTQRPVTHDSPDAQAVPHAPQLRRSVCVSAQSRVEPVTHSVSVPVHPERHTPAEHT